MTPHMLKSRSPISRSKIASRPNSSEYCDRSFGLFLVYTGVLILCLCFAATASASDADGSRPVKSAIADSDDGGVRIRINATSKRFDSDEDEEQYTYPRIRFRRGLGRVTFIYEDEGYDAVAVASSFNDWIPEPMELDSLESLWTLQVNLEPGRYLYHFIVQDEDGEWEAIDPYNDSALRDSDHGWVSRFRIKRERRIRYSRDTSNRYCRDELEKMYGDIEAGIDYQRVDGLFLFMSPGLYARHEFGTSVKGRIGYGFKSEEWSASGSLVQPLDPAGHVQLILSGYAETAFTEQTGIGETENFLAAVLFKEDFRDYYRREGFTAQLVLNANRYFRLAAGYRVDDYSSLENKASWSLGGGEFRPNPSVQEGTMRSVFGQARFGDDNANLRLSYETCGDDIAGGDYEFEQLTAQIRHQIPLGPDKRMDMRVKYGKALSGWLPNQRRYLAGGLGTVRGYDYQSLLIGQSSLTPPVNPAFQPAVHGGQQMFLANAEFKFDLDWGWFWDWSWDWDVDWEDEWDDDFGFDLAVFFDTGMVWEDKDANVDFNDLKSSAGIGLLFGDDDGDIRLNIIQVLDDRDKDIVWQLRINRMF